MRANANVNLLQLAALKSAHLAVEPFDASDHARGWTLLDRNNPDDGDGAALMIGGHGCVSPTRWEAVAEGLGRLAAGLYGPEYVDTALNALDAETADALDRIAELLNARAEPTSTLDAVADVIRASGRAVRVREVTA